MDEKEFDKHAPEEIDENPEVNPEKKVGSPKELPAERMKRLVASSEEDTIPPIRFESQMEPEQEPDGTMGWYEPEAERIIASPSETVSPGSSSPPDATGGWFDVEKTDSAEHDTESGQPEQTKGWYEGQNVETPSIPPAKQATRAIHTARRPTPDQTQPTTTHRPARPAPVPPPKGSSASLPSRVPREDRDATRVTPAAYHGGTRFSQTRPSPAVNYSPPPPEAVSPPTSGNGNGGVKRTLGCLLKAGIGFLFVIILLIAIAGSFAVFKYFSIAQDLPDVEDLQLRASQFETTRILDRDGNTLYEILDPNAGRRTYVSLDKVSPYLVAATIATEDKEFYNHPGYDPVAIARALWQNYTSQEVVSGASTITQQLARNLLFTPSERTETTYERKSREIILAAEITRRYSKDEILELYLNESFYGNRAYGIEAAAETYFNTTAAQLNLAQASFLAGLPQAPAIHDIFTNREGTLRRHQMVLLLMYQINKEEGCIIVSNSPQPGVRGRGCRGQRRGGDTELFL